MNLLTNDEIYTAYIEAANQSLRPQDERIALGFARAIIAATVAKLAAGVSVEPPIPEMVARFGPPTYTLDQLTTAIAAARVAAITECAEECDRTASDYKGMFAEDDSLCIAATDCAKEIRALIGANDGL